RAGLRPASPEEGCRAGGSELRRRLNATPSVSTQRSVTLGFKLPFLSRVSGGPAPAPVAFPPPYRRMIAINSDVQLTSWPMQMHLFREFADRDLEPAFSYWLFGDLAATRHFFNRDFSLTPMAPAALGLARAGLLDTIHSFTGVRNGRGYQFDRDMIRQG